jgi:aspartate carbamoyltransferase
MAEAQVLSSIAGDFAHKDIISIDQFEREDVEQLMREADGMATMVQEQGRGDLLSDLVIANLFYEPSTRTFLSFEAAAKRLGAATIATQGVEYSSISKGETLEDTIRTVERYADTIAMRHPDQGAAAKAAVVSRIPIINGGDGVGEHPTQALLDLYTIKHKLGSVEDLTVTMVGDLKNGRTVHSLAKLLALYGARLNYVSPSVLNMPEELTDELSLRGIKQYATENIEEVIGESEVIYMTRVQKERFKDDPEEYERIIQGSYVVDEAVMEQANPETILMHPLPRVDEIHPSVDSDPRAAYFDEVEAGMYVRMGLLALVNGRSILAGPGVLPAERRRIKPWMKINGEQN